MSSLPHLVALVSESSAVTFQDVSQAAAAISKQAARDFGPLWGVNATVDAFPALENVPTDYWPVMIRDDINQPGAAGYHTDDNGQPFALVQADDSWPLTAAHETLEMLADPSGNRTVAGAPPPNSPAPVSGFRRVLYLVEVCDPCESADFAYESNGVQVSDFITPSYYNSHVKSGVRYSFTGNVKAPHTVLEGGYVSFGNPVTNEWYQIIVVNGQTQLRDLGKLQRNGRSLRETIDARVREIRRDEHYRTRKPEAAKAAAAGGFPDTSKQRAKALHAFIGKL